MIKAKMFEALRSVSPRLAALLGDGKTKQIQTGYRNEDLSLTEKGKDILLEKLSDDSEYDAALTAAAQRDLDEAEKEKDSK